MLFFDIEIAKLDSIDSKDYDMMREEIQGFDFMPEYNKIICISYVDQSDWSTHSLVGDEKEIIEEWFNLSANQTLCGYNIIGFDIPFIVKRAVILGVKIPNSYKLYGKKPWDMASFDDLFLIWKHLGQKSCNLDTLCNALDIPTPKDKMDGSQVDTYYRDGRIDEIKEYCEKDTQTCVKVWKRFVETNLI